MPSWTPILMRFAIQMRPQSRNGIAKWSWITIREVAANAVYMAEIGCTTGAGVLAHKVGCSAVLALVSVCSMMATAVMVGLVIVRGY
jgi:hypothetical protein